MILKSIKESLFPVKTVLLLAVELDLHVDGADVEELGRLLSLRDEVLGDVEGDFALTRRRVVTIVVDVQLRVYRRQLRLVTVNEEVSKGIRRPFGEQIV